MAPASALVAPRSPAAAAAVIDVAVEYGVSADLALAGTGLAPRDLRAPDAAIGAAQEITVMRNVVGKLGGVPGLGVRAGRRATLPSLGIWGFAMRSARTLGDVVDIAITYGYGGFSWVLSRPWVDPRGQDVCIPYDLSGLPEDVRDFVIERDLAFTTSLLPEFFGTALPIRIRSTLSAERGHALADAFPEIDFSFGEAENAQVLTRRQLAKPLRWGDEEAMRICVRQCEALLAARSSHPGGTAAQLRAELRRDPRDRVTLAAFADRNHVDVRTLRRRLAAEGTSYRELNDQVSDSLAQELLARGGLSPKDVADRLGFSDVTSFTRAFRRWTGETPAAYTRRIRGSG